MLSENQYKVKTSWGWITLDERSYQDYLNGKLWINTSPQGEGRQHAAAALPALPTDISAEAVQLRDLAARQGVYPVLQHVLPGGEAEIPYRSRMSQTKTEDMNLTVRSIHCLMRVGASTFGKLYELMSSGPGLRSIRNLGAKSEKEIQQVFLATCYSLLSPGEQAAYWQRVLDAWKEKQTNREAKETEHLMRERQ